MDAQPTITPSPRAGLGKRTPAPPAPSPYRNNWPSQRGQAAGKGADAQPDDEDDDFARPSIQRVVPAADAPPIAPALALVAPAATQPTAPLDAPATGSADASQPEPAAATALPPPQQEETTMPQPHPARKAKHSAKKPAAGAAKGAKGAKGATPQFQILALLMAKGDMTREALLADVSADARPFANALYNAKQAGRIVYLSEQDKYRITDAGRDWATGGANLASQKAMGGAVPPPKPAKDTKAVAEPTFRCAVYSDGSFHLAKAGQAVDLTPAEYAAMLRYAKRMADTQPL